MEILFEDSYLLVVNKPADCIVEGPAKDGQLSLTHIIQRERNLIVFPCHRLDKDTTGILVFAKKKSVLHPVSGQFAQRAVRKTYLACVEGTWNPGWNRVETNIRRTSGHRMENSTEGKLAVTTFRRLAQWNHKSLLEALPKTGRTHQIRLHCLHYQCPVLGDGVYGNRLPDQPPMALHAWKLRIKHPASKELLSFQAPLPDYWQSYWLKDCPVDL